MTSLLAITDHLEKEKRTITDCLSEIQHLKLAQDPTSKVYSFYHSMEIVLEGLDNSMFEYSHNLDLLESALQENKEMKKAFDNMVNRVQIMESWLAAYAEHERKSDVSGKV